DLDVAAFRPPELPESLPECGHVSFKFRVALRVRHQHADAAHALGLLRPHGKRPPDRHAAQKCDELAPLHVSPREDHAFMQGLKPSTLRPQCPPWVKSKHVQREGSCPLYTRKRHQMRHHGTPAWAKSGH